MTTATKKQTIKIPVNMTLKTSLAHFGDERMGTTQVMRTMKYLYEGDYVNVPVYSGNAFRGILRREAMREYLDLLDISQEGTSAKLFYMLFCGGALTSGSRYAEIGEKRRMREMCPPLALLGTAVGDQIIEGKLKSPIFIPVCRETAAYTGVGSEISFYDMLDGTFYTRMDDLKTNDFNISDAAKHDNPVQMKYEMQCLAAGTVLTGNIVIEMASELDTACFASAIEKFLESPYIGGKSAAGHGEVKLEYQMEVSPEAYREYVMSQKEEMRLWVREIEEKLK